MFNLSTLFKSILLFAIVFVAFWIRIQSASGIPEGHFTGADAYLYYFQAQQISEHGKLPERDMHRWLPVGRDNGQLLNLYSYVLAYIHKAVSVVFPNVTLYDVCVYMPVLCFCTGLGVLCLFLAHTFGGSLRVSWVCFWRPSRVLSTEVLPVLGTEMHGAGCSVSSPS